ncbi:MAG: dTDP-4-dehydrorhamnose 3,5-epimerase [Candidatus Pseudobacter hemicellulosilyticus]|uniref:dTDP-4-dehydrorhamnose 3,5-epimerase n=1 Tax=Candidatus Pseudobacter hemicellulosilyticus TaxID=3121375 RepID=A0AAJ5WR18_9BACT|nr:MAG: dTDP-4-dehydrorhamnose 3,5-epimerase [Pseudobacter sp.]
MIFTPTPLEGSYLVGLQPFSDDRGWFARFYCKEAFSSIGHTQEWVQMNHSFTRQAGTIRGMHYQLPPFREIKLVRCIAGAVLDVIVDCRQGSPTFLQWFSAELSAANQQMMYIPQGFAHGFQALTADCELIYLHSELYKPGAEGGLRYNDPALHIQWPLAAVNLSGRDGQHPLLDQNFKGI